MSLSPFDSFQSRFVTYLLNFPRITGWWQRKSRLKDRDDDSMAVVISRSIVPIRLGIMGI